MKYEICTTCGAIAETERMTDHNLPSGGSITKCLECDGNAYNSAKDGLADKLNNIIHAVHVLWIEVYSQKETKATDEPVSGSESTHEKKGNDEGNNKPDTQATGETVIQSGVDEKQAETQRILK